jgi:hypothetical protein
LGDPSLTQTLHRRFRCRAPLSDGDDPLHLVVDERELEVKSAAPGRMKRPIFQEWSRRRCSSSTVLVHRSPIDRRIVA